jgi:hypothetical protein
MNSTGGNGVFFVFLHFKLLGGFFFAVLCRAEINIYVPAVLRLYLPKLPGGKVHHVGNKNIGKLLDPYVKKVHTFIVKLPAVGNLVFKL